MKKRGGGNRKEVRPTKKRKVDQVASEDKTERYMGGVGIRWSAFVWRPIGFFNVIGSLRRKFCHK